MDVAALSAPIAEDATTGIDLRLDHSSTSIYHRLRDLRTAARNNERSAIADGEKNFINPRDWLQIASMVPDIIHSTSKDIELVAWWIEALTRTEGFSGLARGYRLARELIEQYGNALYPQPDEDGLTTQLSALIGLNGYGGEGALIQPIKSIAMTAGSPPAPYAVWQCEQAFDLERLSGNKREAKIKEGHVTRANLDLAVAETDITFFIQLHADMQQAIAEYQAFQAVIDSYCSDEPQPTGRILECLEKCLQALHYMVGDRLTVQGATDTDSKAPTVSEESPADNNNYSPEAPIMDRESALQGLKSIAAFFRRTEPHSPISYAIDQAVRWSHLSLPDLIAELIPDESARGKYKSLTGIRANSEKNSS